MVLFHQEGLSYLDIGQITSLPEGTIKSYLFRARKQLKDSVLAEDKMEEL
jgi:RNA polymerase sigma-70 factor (ECF subfamily)